MSRSEGLRKFVQGVICPNMAIFALNSCQLGVISSELEEFGKTVLSEKICGGQLSLAWGVSLGAGGNAYLVIMIIVCVLPIIR